MTTTKLYASVDDFIAYELRPAVEAGEGVREGFNLRDLFIRLEDAELIIWSDGRDPARPNVIWLDRQGYVFATDEDGEQDHAAFWAAVEDLNLQVAQA